MTDILFRLALNYGCRPHLGWFHTANCLCATSREKSGAEVKLQGTNRWPARRRLLRSPLLASTFSFPLRGQGVL